jgi:hypothetical protein
VDRNRKSCSDETVKTEKHRGPLGIRFNVWLFVSGLLLVCGLLISLPSLQESRRIADAARAPEKLAPQDGSTKAKMNSWRRANSSFTSESFQPNDLGAPVSLTNEAATKLACERANQRAKELYGCEPFADVPPAQFVGGH